MTSRPLRCDLLAQDITMAPIQAAGGNFNVYDIRKPCIGAHLIHYLPFTGKKFGCSLHSRKNNPG